MAGWAELPNDLIAHIANRVKVIEDFIAFRAVCTSWRIATTKDNFNVLLPQVPLLMLGAEDNDYQEFYSLFKKKVSHIFLPEVRGLEFLPLTEGWLCTVVNNTGEINLLHPFSHNKIHLPSLKALLTFHESHCLCIDGVVLSANPSITSDYVLMLRHCGAGSCLAFWRSGDLDWTHINVVNDFGIEALVYRKGQFYSMTYFGEVRAYEVAGPNTTDQLIVKTRLVADIYEYNFNLPGIVQYYLVELSGALLLVSRFDHFDRIEDGPKGALHTIKFKVFELDVIRGELREEMKTLGDSSIFLGPNWASCIDSSKFTGIKPNHIYIIDDCLIDEGGDTTDMGAYNLEDGKFESFYPGRSPSSICLPAWVMPSLK